MKFGSMKKVLAAGLAVVVSAALLAGCGGDQASQKKFLNIGTGGTAGTYYPIGGAIAEILNNNIEGMNASAQSTGATVANINMLKDGNVDAAFLTAGYPTASVQDISSQNKIRLLPIDGDKADALIAKYPFYTKTKIPAGTYAGFDEELPTISVMSMLVVNDKVDDKLGYEIAKAIFSNLDRLQAAHSVGKLISKETAEKGMSLDMNAGAKKFFEESK